MSSLSTINRCLQLAAVQHSVLYHCFVLISWLPQHAPMNYYNPHSNLIQRSVPLLWMCLKSRKIWDYLKIKQWYVYNSIIVWFLSSSVLGLLYQSVFLSTCIAVLPSSVSVSWYCACRLIVTLPWLSGALDWATVLLSHACNSTTKCLLWRRSGVREAIHRNTEKLAHTIGVTF